VYFDIYKQKGTSVSKHIQGTYKPKYNI